MKSIQLYVKDGTETNNVIQRNANTKTYALILLHRSRFLIQYSVSVRPKKLGLVIPLQNGSYDVLIPEEITMKTNDELIIKDYSNSLWLANLNNIKHSIQYKDIELFVEVKYLGSLLGISTALNVPPIIDGDTNQYLYYYLPRDGAVVRWYFR